MRPRRAERRGKSRSAGARPPHWARLARMSAKLGLRGSAKLGAARRGGRIAPFPAAGRQRRAKKADGRGGRMASTVAVPPVVEARAAPRPGVCLTAPTTSPRTRPELRKRTSALAGWTLTSTSLGSQATNSATMAWRSRGRIIHIGGAQRAGERLVAHRAAIDEDELMQRVRPAEGREADAADEAHAFARGVEAKRIGGEVVAERLTQPLGLRPLARAAGRPVEAGRRFRSRRKSGSRDGPARAGARCRRPPAPRRDRISGTSAAPASPRRDRAPRSACPHGWRAGRGRALDAVLHPKLRGRSPRPARGSGFRAATPRRSRAAPRRESRASRSRQSPSGIFEVAWRSTQSSRSAASMPTPSSLTRIRPPPARLDRDLDPPRAGVERVLDEFLDRRSRPLDHLARGDAVDEQRIESANRHGGADLG